MKCMKKGKKTQLAKLLDLKTDDGKEILTTFYISEQLHKDLKKALKHRGITLKEFFVASAQDFVMNNVQFVI